MAKVSVRWNMAALGRCVGRAPETVEAVTRATEGIKSSANAMGAGFRTGLYHRDHKSPAVGNTQPVYDGDVRQTSKSVVGIVHTGNYAAMRDNHENNTLLKAVANAGV